MTTTGEISSIPTGALMPFAAAAAPTGWLICDGAAKDRTIFAALFAVVGVVYGIGNGSTTFNIPDMRGRAPFGIDSGAGRITSDNTLGDSSGHEDLPLHTHTLSSHTHPAGSHTHPMASHTHSGGSHSHPMASHVHAVRNHTHSMAGHTHAQGAQTVSFSSTEGGGTSTTLRVDQGGFGVVACFIAGTRFVSGSVAPGGCGIISAISAGGSTGGPSVGSTGFMSGGVSPTVGSNTYGPSVTSTGAVAAGTTSGPSSADTGSSVGSTGGPSVTDTGGTGGGSSANNLPPYQMFNYIIKT